MKQLRVFSIALILILLKSSNVSADCSIQFGKFPPKVVSHFGSKNVILESSPLLIREMFETIDLYCANGFTTQGYTNREHKQSHFQLTCEYNGFFTITGYEHEKVNHVDCVSNQENQMYQSNTSLPDCERWMTLVIGFNFEEQGSLKNVALCYDLFKNHIKYMSYTTYPSKVIEQIPGSQMNRLGLDVRVSYKNGIFKKISSLDINEALNMDKQLKELFGVETYEYANLIQDTLINKDLLGFDNIFNIIWLRALRTGNWRHLLNALHKANVNGMYDVNVGTSGIVHLPVMQNCTEKSKFMFELLNGEIVSAPAYIWSHIRALQPTVNSTDEFVVIAQNSPFVTSMERQELCKSMCHEVDWLKDTLFNRLRDNPVFGLVQCCHVSDVATKLENFPLLAVETPKIELLQDNNKILS